MCERACVCMCVCARSRLQYTQTAQNQQIEFDKNLNRRKIWKSSGSNIRSPYLSRVSVCLCVYVWERQRKNDYANKVVATHKHTHSRIPAWTPKKWYIFRENFQHSVQICSSFSSVHGIAVVSITNFVLFPFNFTAYSCFFLITCYSLHRCVRSIAGAFLKFKMFSVHTHSLTRSTTTWHGI